MARAAAVVVEEAAEEWAVARAAAEVARKEAAVEWAVAGGLHSVGADVGGHSSANVGGRAASARDEGALLLVRPDRRGEGDGAVCISGCTCALCGHKYFFLQARAEGVANHDGYEPDGKHRGLVAERAQVVQGVQNFSVWSSSSRLPLGSPCTAAARANDARRVARCFQEEAQGFLRGGSRQNGETWERQEGPRVQQQSTKEKKKPRAWLPGHRAVGGGWSSSPCLGP